MMMRLILLLIALAGMTGRTISAVVQVDEPKVCYACHSEIEALKAKKSQHTAFAGRPCSSCHNPHASKHARLIDDDIRGLCLRCHDNIKLELQKQSVHQPVADGDCLSCHDPHATDLKNQLKQKQVPLCSGCHSEVCGWMTQSTVHQPVKNGTCDACHKPHGADSEHLLAREVPGLCFGCHKQDAAFGTAHKGYDLSNANCVTCHDPHASGRPRLLMANQHAPFRAGTCTSCHTSGGNSAFALTGDIRTLCLKCHKPVADEAAQPYSHNLNDKRSCLNCHNAHASSVNSLLAAAQKNVCMRCHFTGDKYKSKTRDAYITHNGMDCSSCHSPHGSDNPTYFKKLGLELCMGCHPAAHKGSHPFGANVIDPRTKGPVTCTSCHTLHGADFKPYLPLDPSMDLCIQCHKR